MGTEMRRRMAAFGLSESFLPRYWSFWALLLGQSLPCMLKLILVRMQRLFSGWTGRTLSLMLRKIWDGWFWLSSRKECILDKGQREEKPLRKMWPEHHRHVRQAIWFHGDNKKRWGSFVSHVFTARTVHLQPHLSFPLSGWSCVSGTCGSATDAHLHAREVHRLVHQDPCGCLKAWRDGHRSIVSDKTTRLGVNLLYVQAGQ